MQSSNRQILKNAKITTLNTSSDICDTKIEAISIVNGRIEALGTLKEIEQFCAQSPYEEIDCENKYLYPGFIDSHSHLNLYANMLDYVFCGEPAKNIEELILLLKEKAKTTPKGEWILGYSYDDSVLADNRHLDKHDLDRVSTEHPIMIFHISVHMGYINSCAIQKLALTPESVIDGGEYVTDSTGELTGFLVEFAFFESQKFLPLIDNATRYNNFKKAISHYNAQGFTSFFDGGLGIGGVFASVLQTYLALDKAKELNARAYLQTLAEDMETLKDFGLYDFGSDYVKFGGLKYFTDGSIQGFTAALKEDYYTKKGFKSELLMEQEEIDTIIERYHCANIQIAVHTNGDAASEAVILAFEKAFKKNPRTDLHHMLIHAQMLSDEHLARMKTCGIIPSFFSRHIETWGDRHASIFIGPERMERLNPAGSAVRLGMPITLHVDSPVLPVTALGSMHAAVNRISDAGILFGADQRISPLQALEAYTKYAGLCCNSKATLETMDRGIIAVGKYADFVLLEENLLEVDPLKIKDIKVLKTICAGKVVYSDC